MALLYYSGTFIVRDLSIHMADIMRILISLTEESVDNTCQMFQGVRQKCLTSGGWSTSRNIRNCDEEILWQAKLANLSFLIIYEVGQVITAVYIAILLTFYSGPIEIKKMHTVIQHLATTLVTLGIQSMIEVEKIFKKENWDVDGKNFWTTTFSPFLWFLYACVFIFAAMLLLRLLLVRRKKRSIDFRFSQRARVPYYMKSVDYDYQ